MTVPGNLSSPLLATAAAAAAAGDSNRSLRFNNSDSAYLVRTPSSTGNRRTWTLSVWFKRSELSATNSYNAIWSTGTDGDNYCTIYIDNNDRIFLQEYTGSTDFQFLGAPRLRDVASFYHAVIAFDSTQATSTNRIKMYINGVQIDSAGSAIYPSQNYDSMINLTNGHSLGRNHAYNNFFFSGYMAHAIFIDGSQLSPTSFGSFDSNGVWQKADYSGTFGTNGFHLLDFANESTIGADSSGNNNDFTANNLSDTAGAGNDVLLDYPANGDSSNDSGAGGEVNGNYPTLSSIDNLDSGVALSNGNLHAAVGSGTSSKNPRSTIYLNSGKWYWEMTVSAKSTFLMAGIATSSVGKSGAALNQTGGYGYGSGGNYYAGSGSVSDSSPATFTTNDVIGVKWDADAGTLEFFKNNTSQGTISSIPSDYYSPAFTITSSNDAFDVNFGQRAFSYSAPTNHKPICTATLPTPAIADGSDHFDTKLFTGNGTTQTISGLSMSPDLVWLKSRSAADNHSFFDSVRGAPKGFHTNLDDSEFNDSSTLTGFTSDGWTMAGHAVTNADDQNYVGWAWDAGSSTASNTDGSITTSVRANQTCGFSIATYSFNNSLGSQTLGHGLGAIPDVVIRKDRNLGEDWSVYSKAIGFTQRGHLNLTHTFSGTSTFGSSSATSTVNRANNMNNGNYVDYSFVAIPGFSSFGTYEGNGSTDGPFVYTGFRVAFVMLKNVDVGSSGYNWHMNDVARDPINMSSSYLNADNSNAEASFNSIDFLSNGFKLRASGASYNGNNNTFFYMCFAENPFQANGGLAR